MSFVDAPGLRSTAEELTVLLAEHRAEVIDRWVDLVLYRPDSRYRRYSRRDLVGWFSSGFDAIHTTLSTGSTARLERHLQDVSLARLRLGFGIDEVTRALMLLEKAAIPFVVNAFPDDHDRLSAALDDLGGCMRTVIARFGSMYASGMRHALEEREHRTGLMLEAAETAGGSLDVEEVLERVARFVAAALGVSHCHLYTLDRERGDFVPRADGFQDGPCRVMKQRRLSVERDPAVAEVGRALVPVFRRWSSGEQPGLARDESTEGICGTLLLPIAVGQRILALAAVFLFDPARGFSDDEIRLAGGVCKAVASAVENARLHDATRRRLVETRSLQTVVAALLERVDLKELLDLVCREAKRLTGADECRVVLLADVPWDADAGSARATPVDSKARLVVPLRSEGENIGSLQLVSHRGEFTRHHRRLVAVFAHQAAIAISSARLRRDYQKIAVLEERQRLARDLHDAVTQSLYGVSLYTEAAARLLDAGELEHAASHLREARSTATAALREMRLMIFELQPSVLEHEGLAPALQTRLSAVEERVGMRTELRVTGSARPPHEIEEQLHRIAQEALNNALKHSFANSVRVHLWQTGDGAGLAIEDDGVGFDPRQGRSMGGLGLCGMETRAARIGARLDIVSKPGEGTSVRVELNYGERPPSRQRP